MANSRSGRTGRSRLFPVLQCFSAPAPPPPLPSWIVLEDSFHVGKPPLRLEQEWAVVECAKRTAYGCGEHGQEVLDGLTLYVRLVEPRSVTSAIYIDASDDALRSIRVQFRDTLPWAPQIPTDGKLGAQGTVMTADSNHMVIVINFQLECFDDLIYYLLYDAFDSSLTMVPCPPEPRLCKTNGSVTPLAVPRDRSDGAGGYDMVVKSQKMVPPPEDGGGYTKDDVIYTWTPSAAGDPWQVKGRPVFPQIVEEPFLVDYGMCFQGKVFFGDVTQGLVCYDLQVPNSDRVHFDFIPLPPEIHSTLRWETNNMEYTSRGDRKRAMGCAQGSIKFVCTDDSAGSDANANVSVWTLDLSINQWKKDHEFRAIQLWKMFGFKKKGLPETPPKCPVLMPDGSVTFLLPRMCINIQDPIEDYICNLDFGSRRVRWSALLDSCSFTPPIVIPGDFFTMVIPPNNLTPRMGILQ